MHRGTLEELMMMRFDALQPILPVPRWCARPRVENVMEFLNFKNLKLKSVHFKNTKTLISFKFMTIFSNNQLTLF